MKKIDKILDQRLKKTALDKISQAAYVCHRAEKIAQKYQFTVIAYQKQTLSIRVENHLQAQEIEFKKNQIISEVNELLGRNLIKNLKYFI